MKLYGGKNEIKRMNILQFKCARESLNFQNTYRIIFKLYLLDYKNIKHWGFLPFIVSFITKRNDNSKIIIFYEISVPRREGCEDNYFRR